MESVKMKWMILLLLCSLSTESFSQEDPLKLKLQADWGPWQQFQKLYESGNYSEALQELQSQEMPQEPFYFYNLGTVYFKLDEFGKSLAYFAKANYMMPYHAKIRSNLSLAEEQVQKQLGISNLDPSSEWLEEMADQIPQRVMGGVWGMVLFFMLAICLRNYIRFRNIRTALSHGSTAVAGVALLATFLVLMAKSYATWHPPAYVLETHTLRSGPGDHLLDLGILRAGLKVRITGQSLQDKSDKTWSQIRYGQDRYGWIQKTALLPLE